MTSKRILKLTRIPMEVRAQDTWKETIEKEAIARLMFVKPEWEDEDLWFDRTQYRPRGKPIILTAPGMKSSDVASNTDNSEEKTKEMSMFYTLKKEHHVI